MMALIFFHEYEFIKNNWKIEKALSGGMWTQSDDILMAQPHVIRLKNYF